MTGPWWALPATHEQDPNLWALDLKPFPWPDGPLQPVQAHLIVMARREQHRGETRIAACGREFTAGTHPRGWWGSRWGSLPLRDHAIHCGAEIVQEQLGDA